MITIVCANGKGGVGKSTIVALLIEYCEYMNIPIDLIDADPNSTTQSYVQYAREEGRELLSSSPQIKIIDTAGISGSALSFLRKATLILCPFKANFADTDIMVNWFYTFTYFVFQKIIGVVFQSAEYVLYHLFFHKIHFLASLF